MSPENMEKAIRDCALKGCLQYSKHAVERMAERGIGCLSVNLALRHGKVIEAQVHNEMLKLIFQEHTTNTPSFYVVAAYNGRAFIITVCLSLAECWELQNGMLRRKP